VFATSGYGLLPWFTSELHPSNTSFTNTFMRDDAYGRANAQIGQPTDAHLHLELGQVLVVRFNLPLPTTQVTSQAKCTSNTTDILLWFLLNSSAQPSISGPKVPTVSSVRQSHLQAPLSAWQQPKAGPKAMRPGVITGESVLAGTIGMVSEHGIPLRRPKTVSR